jgi:hypothetical protein
MKVSSDRYKAGSEVKSQEILNVPGQDLKTIVSAAD